jgi:hypothetical protein
MIEGGGDPQQGRVLAHQRHFRLADVFLLSLKTEMALTPPERSALSRSITALVLAVLAISFALYSNMPLTKTLTFDIPCERFTVPATITLQLQNGNTQLNTLAADGLVGTVAHIASGTFKQESQSSQQAKQQYALEESPDQSQSRPHLQLAIKGGVGKMEAQLNDTTELESTGRAGEPPVLTVHSSKPADVTFTLVTTLLSLNGDRFLIPEQDPRNLIQFAANLSGPMPGVALTLKPGTRPASYARLTFASSTEDLALWPAAAGLPLPSNTVLQFGRAMNPDLRLGLKTADELIRDHPIDLTIATASGGISQISIIGAPPPQTAATLRITGTVQVKSLRQDGHELLPTILHEILEEPYAIRSLLLVALGLLAAVLLKVVDRALSVLLEYILPKV